MIEHGNFSVCYDGSSSGGDSEWEDQNREIFHDSAYGQIFNGV